MTRILMVVSNHGDIEGEPIAGVWFCEIAEPFEVFIKAGIDITVARPRGGQSGSIQRRGIS